MSLSDSNPSKRRCTCGLLDWTIRDYGRLTHKHGCPGRTEPFCQTHPDGCSLADSDPSPRLYRTIVADPPWPMGAPHGNRSGSTRGRWAPYIGQTATAIPYSMMSLGEIKALPIADFAERDAHLYIWTVNKFLEETYEVARHWDFQPSTLLTWCKAPMGIGLGWAYSLTTEHVLFCRRGQLPYQRRVDSSWWQWKRGPHSTKPAAFLDLVEQVSPGPYLELFARRQRLGWDTWGDEALNHLEASWA